jgi:PAS domain S-box-containing protein
MRYHRLQRNLVSTFALVGVLLVGIAAWSVVNDYERRLDEAGAQTSVLVRALDGQVEAFLAGNEVTLRQTAKKIADAGGLRAVGRGQLQSILKTAPGLTPGAPVIFVLDPEGELLANSADPSIRAPRAPVVGCLLTLRAQPDAPMCVGKLIKSPISGQWRITVSVALVDKQGQFEGYVGMGLDPRFFESFYRSLGLGGDFALALTRNDGIVLVHFPWVEPQPGRELTQGGLFSHGIPQSKSGTLTLKDYPDGRGRILSYFTVPRYLLVVSASVLEDGLLAPWLADTLAKAAFVLLAMLGIAGLLLVSLRQLRRLEASEADLVFSKFSTDRSAEMVFWVEREGRFYYVNNAMCARTGYSKAELLGRTIFDLCPDIEPQAWDRRVRELGKLGARRLSQTAVTKLGEKFTVGVVASMVEFSGRSLICVNARDETAQRAAEAALRESESRYRSTVDSLHEGILVRDRERILACNPSAERIFGIPADGIVGRLALAPLVKFYNVDGTLVEEGSGPAFRALRSGTAQTGHTYRVERPDGTSLWVEANSVPLFKAGEETPYRAVATYADVTTRREAETALRASEEKFSRVFDLIPDLVTVTDVETGCYVDMNQAWTPLTGFTRIEALGRTSSELRIWAGPADRQQMIDDAVAQGEVRDREINFRRKDGSIFFSNVSACVFEVQGRRLLMLIVRDITERKRAEAALAESESKFREIFETSLDPIWIARVCDNGRIEYEDWNKAHVMALGRSVADARGKTPHELFPQWAADLIMGHWRECIAGGVPMSGEERWPLPGGTRVWFSSVVPLYGADGKVYRLAGIARDITDRIAAEGNIRRLNEELELRVAERTRELEIANKELEAFSYSVSHDLRAPLRAIDGFSALLARSPPAVTDRKAQDYLPRIRSAALRMGRLIDDMLNLSRVGRHQLHRERFDLGGLAREVCEEIRNSDPSRNVGFQVEGNLQVEGDASLLRIALNNLIGNAWKFSAPKSDARITVRGERDRDTVSIAVTDNGVGFDPAYSARLFGAFQRLHNDSEFAGSGIGLAIVQRIVHRHGGEITASGTPGEGATFVIKLPLGRVPHAEAQT